MSWRPGISSWSAWRRTSTLCRIATPFPCRALASAPRWEDPQGCVWSYCSWENLRVGIRKRERLGKITVAFSDGGHKKSGLAIPSRSRNNSCYYFSTYNFQYNSRYVPACSFLFLFLRKKKKGERGILPLACTPSFWTLGRALGVQSAHRSGSQLRLSFLALSSSSSESVVKSFLAISSEPFSRKNCTAVW